MKFLLLLLSLVAPCAAWAQTPISAPDSGAVAVAVTVNSSSHAAGNSLGGLITIPLAARPGTGGILTQVAWVSPNGSTGQIVIRIWQVKPASTTCTDQAAFAGNATDDLNLIAPPFTMTPAAPAVTTGDSKTYAVSSGLTIDWKNLDNPQTTRNLYACVVTVSTDTADESSSPWIVLSGPQGG